MPKIESISNKMEKKIDLSPFFGEEAFITIKKLNKYQFSFLLNKNRQSYSAKLFEICKEWRDDTGADTIPAEEYQKLKLSIGMAEAQEMMRVEDEVDREYYSLSIKPDGHNFTDNDGEIIPITGDWFYTQFSGLSNPEGRSMNDFIINEIVTFNYTGIALGE
jgi:hypothetical protein